MIQPGEMMMNVLMGVVVVVDVTLSAVLPDLSRLPVVRPVD
jgi:hypothetical protein